jgi:hypothetical protein
MVSVQLCVPNPYIYSVIFITSETSLAILLIIKTKSVFCLLLASFIISCLLRQNRRVRSNYTTTRIRVDA